MGLVRNEAVKPLLRQVEFSFTDEPCDMCQLRTLSRVRARTAQHSPNRKNGEHCSTRSGNSLTRWFARPGSDSMDRLPLLLGHHATHQQFSSTVETKSPTILDG